MDKRFVWGDNWPPSKGSGNFADESAKKIFPNWKTLSGYDDSYAYTAPMMSFNPNGYGMTWLVMYGNGAQTGIAKIIMKSHPTRTQQDQI